MKNRKLANKFLTVCLIFLSFALCINPAYAGRRRSKKKEVPAVEARYFVNFDDAEYRTSPDKRIGAKILVDPDVIGPSIASMIHLTYLPGAHVLSHRHVYSSEIIYVLSGTLTVKIGNYVQTVSANGSVFIPAGSFHEYLNDSADVVQFIQMYSPAAPEEEYRRWVKPSDEAKKAEQKAAEPKIETIVTPSMPIVPGSPDTTIGDVVTPEPTDADSLRERIKDALRKYEGN